MTRPKRADAGYFENYILVIPIPFICGGSLYGVIALLYCNTAMELFSPFGLMKLLGLGFETFSSSKQLLSPYNSSV